MDVGALDSNVYAYQQWGKAISVTFGRRLIYQNLIGFGCCVCVSEFVCKGMWVCIMGVWVAWCFKDAICMI